MFFRVMFESMPLLAQILFVIIAVLAVYMLFAKPLEILYHKLFTKPETVRAQLRRITKVMPLIAEKGETLEERRPDDTYVLGFRTQDQRNKFFEVSWEIADQMEKNTEGMLTFHWKKFISFTDAEKVELEEGENGNDFFRTYEEF